MSKRSAGGTTTSFGTSILPSADPITPEYLIGAAAGTSVQFYQLGRYRPIQVRKWTTVATPEATHVAFWPADTFPFLRWGEFADPHDRLLSGGVHVRGHGAVSPSATLPLEEGREAVAALERLVEQYARAQAILREQYVSLLREAASFALAAEHLK